MHYATLFSNTSDQLRRHKEAAILYGKALKRTTVGTKSNKTIPHNAVSCIKKEKQFFYIYYSYITSVAFKMPN